MNDYQRLRALVLGHDKPIHNHVGTAPTLRARAERIDDMRYFTTNDYNGRVLPQEKYNAPAKLPAIGVFKTLQR